MQADASICFMALILHRVMRMRLRAANTNVAPEQALQFLKRIEHHRISIQALQKWQAENPDLFVKRVYKNAGLDTKTSTRGRAPYNVRLLC